MSTLKTDELPCAVEFERAVVGLCLTKPGDAMPNCVEALTIDSFVDPVCREVWHVMTALFNQGEFDSNMVTVDLHGSGKLAEFGGPGAIIDLIEASLLSAELLPSYLDGLRDKQQRRQMLKAAEEIRSLARDTTIGVPDALAIGQGSLLDIAGKGSRTARTSSEVIMDVMKQCEVAYRKRGHVTRGLATGYADLDRQLMGLKGKYLYILAARPAMGKSALAMNIAEHVAMEGTGVLIYSMEMPDVDIGMRMVAGRAQVDLQKTRDGLFAKSEFQKMIASGAELARTKIHFYDQPGLTIGDIGARTRLMKARHNIGLVVVDYLQKVKGVSRRSQDSRYAEVGEVSGGLKEMAMELDLPVLVPAQLNRGPEDRKDGKPKMSDLRESGDIEQDADVIMLLHRPGYYTKEEGDDRAFLDIAKHRNGPVGECEFRFVPPWARFQDPTGKKLYDDHGHRVDGDGFRVEADGVKW